MTTKRKSYKGLVIVLTFDSVIHLREPGSEG